MKHQSNATVLAMLADSCRTYVSTTLQCGYWVLVLCGDSQQHAFTPTAYYPFKQEPPSVFHYPNIPQTIKVDMGVLLKLAAVMKTRVFWVCAFAALTAVVVVIGASATHVRDGLNAFDLQEVDRSMLFFIEDSLTERGESSEQSGWITLMRSEYSGSVDIVSRGYSGYNSR